MIDASKTGAVMRYWHQMNHWQHIAVCAGLMVVAFVLVGVGAGNFAFNAPLGCALMMGVMIWGMVRGAGHGHR